MVIAGTARGHVGVGHRAPAGAAPTGVLVEGGDDSRPFAEHAGVPAVTDEAARAPDHTGIVRTVVRSGATGGSDDSGTVRTTPHRGMHVLRKRRPVHAGHPGGGSRRRRPPGPGTPREKTPR